MIQRAARGAHLEEKFFLKRVMLVQYPHSSPVTAHEMIQNLSDKCRNSSKSGE